MPQRPSLVEVYQLMKPVEKAGAWVCRVARDRLGLLVTDEEQPASNKIDASLETVLCIGFEIAVQLSQVETSQPSLQTVLQRSSNESIRGMRQQW